MCRNLRNARKFPEGKNRENPNDEKNKTRLGKMGGLSCWGSLSLQLFPELMDDVTG